MSIQHANRGVVKKDLQLYYNREFPKSFRGQATTNIAYATNSFLNSNSNWWVNSGNTVFNDNDTTIDKPVILNVDTSNLRIFSSTVTVVGNQQLGSSIIPISGSTQYSMSIYYWFSGGSMQSPPYVRANINNNELAYFGYNGDTNYLNWPRRTWIRLTATFTTQANETGVYMSSYTGDTAGEKLAYFGYQIEQKAYVTPLVLGSRTANTVAGGGGLLDISGNNVNADLTNVGFGSSGFTFNGSSTSIDTGYSILNIDPSQGFSIEVIVNFDALTSYSPSTFTISNVNTTTNVITTSVTHNLVAGDRIAFYVSGGSLPSPLLDGSNIAPYYIISPTSNTFKISTSSGGAEVDITTAGSGTITALVPSKAGMLFGRANYGGIGIYYYISATNVISIFGYSRTTAGYYNTPIVTISTGVTYLITVVFDALNQSQYFLYINGVSQGSASCPSSATYSNSTVGNFSIGEGGQADGGGTLVYNPFKGSCPMQRIYRRSLTAAEVLQNFNATRKTYGI